MIKQRNVTGREHCAACGDDGWVELAGTTTIAHTTYSRGMAPCKWCEVGDRRFQHHSAPNQGRGRYEPETNFDGSDIIPVGDEPSHIRAFRPDTDFLRQRAKAGCSIPSLQAIFPRSMWPAEWKPAPPKPNPLTDDEAAEIAEKQRLAQKALETATQEPTSAVEADTRSLGHAETEEVPY